MTVSRRPDFALSQLPQAELLARLQIASEAVSFAKTLPEVKDVRDRIAAIEGYLRQHDTSVQVINETTLLKLRAERRLGEMLSAMPKNDGGRPKTGDTVSPVLKPPKLADLGIQKKQSERWQKVAALPAALVEEKIDQATARGEAISAKEVVKQARKDVQPLVREPAPMPTGKFSVIYADPPWQTDFRRGDDRDVENHYPTMPLEAICALDVPSICAADCVLFLWATQPLLPVAFEVIRNWGFHYKTGAVWHKTGAGMGYYFRVDVEHLLVATHGQPGVPDPSDRVSSLISAPKSRHSEKPAMVRQIIEKMYPNGKRIELFGRGEEPEGWSFWANEAR